MVEGAEALSTGADTTLMVKFNTPLPQPVELVTVYTVVTVGAKVLEDPEPEGAHAYELPPLTLTVTGVPLHIVVFVTDAVRPGDEDTLIVALALSLQPPVVPVTL